MKRQMRNLTYRNLMAVIHKIEAKGYDQPEAERLARSVFAEFLSRPQGMSIEERVRRILTKEEWEKENLECGSVAAEGCAPDFCFSVVHEKVTDGY